MIRLLEGTVKDIELQAITVGVRGVGYLVYTPLPNLFNLGDNVTLYTHLAVRETALDLYGFNSPDELQLFELLLTVPKIGPKSALSIMQQVDATTLITAVSRQDPNHLHKVAGLGKKTAANLVTHLENKLAPLLKRHNAADSKTPTLALTQAQTDAIDALEALGFDAKDSRSEILKLSPEADAKTLIQTILKQS